MHQAWWVYGLVTLVCTSLYLLIKVVEKHVDDDDGILDIIGIILGFFALIAAFQTANALQLFS